MQHYDYYYFLSFSSFVSVFKAELSIFAPVCWSFGWHCVVKVSTVVNIRHVLVKQFDLLKLVVVRGL